MEEGRELKVLKNVFVTFLRFLGKINELYGRLLPVISAAFVG
jgi:hypothetical protein